MYCGRPVAFQEMGNSLHLREVHRSDCVIDLKNKQKNDFVLYLRKMQIHFKSIIPC